MDYFDAALTRPIPAGFVTQAPGAGAITNHFVLAGVGADEIAPDAKLSYKDEFVLGYEWEAFANTNLGVRDIHRGIGRVLEDVAAAPMVAYDLGLPGVETVEYVLTNPSSKTPTIAAELGAQFEDPIHSYDAVEVTLDRRFSGRWSGTVNYRWSRLHGTFEGFYREDNGQSDPGITSLYDFPTNDPSYTAIGVPSFGYAGDIRYLGELGKGPLPLDRPHQVKVYGNYAATDTLAFGIGLNASSGKPLTPLAANPNDGNGGESPTAPPGSGIQTVDGFRERTPFEFQVDAQASYDVRAWREAIATIRRQRTGQVEHQVLQVEARIRELERSRTGLATTFAPRPRCCSRLAARTVATARPPRYSDAGQRPCAAIRGSEKRGRASPWPTCVKGARGMPRGPCRTRNRQVSS